MDSLEKLAQSAFDEMENAFAYFGKIEESMGRVSRILDNIHKKAEDECKVASGGVPPKQTPPKPVPPKPPKTPKDPHYVMPGVNIGCTSDFRKAGINSCCVGGRPVPPTEVKNQPKPKTWHESLDPKSMIKLIVEKSSYVIPSKCLRFRFFEADDGDFFIEFLLTAEHHHSSTTYVAQEEFVMPLVDDLDDQLELFDHHVGSLLTVKFQPKGYADEDKDWSNL